MMQPDSSRIKQIRRWALYLLLSGIAFRLVRYGVGMPLWGDEVMLGIHFLDRSWDDLFQPLKNNQVLPLAHLVMAWVLIEIAGYSEYVVRLPATLYSLAALILLYRFARQQLKEPEAMLALGLLAVSYYTVRYGAEFKPYAGDLFFAIVALVVTTRFIESGFTATSGALFSAVMIFAPIFSYPAIFVTGSCLLVAFLEARRGHSGAAARVGITIVLAAAVFAFYYFLYVVPQSRAGSGLYALWASTFPPAKWYLFPTWLLSQLAGKMMSYPVGGKDFSSILTLLLVAVGWTTAWRRGQRRLVMLCTLPLLLNLVAAALHLYPFGGSARFAQYAAPALVLLGGIGLARVIRWFSGQSANSGRYVRGMRYAAGFLVVLGVLGTAHTIYKPYKTRGVLEVRQVVNQLVGDFGCAPVSVLNSFDQTPVNYAWYLGFEGRGEFGVQTVSADAGHNAPVCAMVFDANAYPGLQKRFAELEKLARAGTLLHRQEGSALIYGGDVRPHPFKVLVFAP